MKKKIILCLVIIILALIGIIFSSSLTNNYEEIIIEKPAEENDETEYADNKYKLLWEENYQYNSDYDGEIIFESGLLSQSFVSAKKALSSYTFYTYNNKIVTDYETCESGPCSLNDVYLRMNYKDMSYDAGGTCFMDYRNSLDYDQNIIIYGHHYSQNLDPERQLFFTPLEKLLSLENYENNKYITLVTRNGIRRYEIVYVYTFDTSSEEQYSRLQFFRTTYDIDYDGNEDPGYYDKYIENVEAVKLYDTGLKLQNTDNTLTLQTCLADTSKGVEIIVAREIERLEYQNSK